MIIYSFKICMDNFFSCTWAKKCFHRKSQYTVINLYFESNWHTIFNVLCGEIKCNWSLQFSNENFLLQTYLTGIFQIHPLLDFLKICPSLKNSQKSKKIKNRQNSRCRLSISSPFEEKFHNISKICHSFQRHCKFSLQIQYFLFCCFFLFFFNFSLFSKSFHKF